MSPYRLIAIMAVVAGTIYCNVSPPSPSAAADADVPVYTGPEIPDTSLFPDSSDASSDNLGAELVINELNATIDDGCDLVELVVTKAGQLQSIVLKERKSIVFEGGASELNADAYILIHFNGGSPLCNPVASGSEMTSLDEFPGATYAGNFDTAFDVYVDDSGLVATDNVLSLYRVDGTMMDAVFVSDDPTGTAAADTESQAFVVAEQGQWTTTTNQVPVGGFVDELFNMHAVHDLNATSSDRSGQSLQRKQGVIDTNHRGDWFSADELPEATWGQPNPS